MDKNEKLRLQLAIDEADTWAKLYRKAMDRRVELRNLAAQSLKKLKAKVLPVEIAGGNYSVLPLSAAQRGELENLARYIQLKPFNDNDAELLHQLDTEVPRAVADAQQGLAARRISDDQQEAAEYLGEYVPWGLAMHIPEALDRITPGGDGITVDLSQALAPEFGLAQALRSYGAAQLVPAAEVRNRLATFTAASQFAELARAVTPEQEYLVVCAPAGKTISDFLAALSVSEN